MSNNSKISLLKKCDEEDLEPVSVKEAHPDGMTCFRCGDFVSLSEPNQPDGTFCCMECRVNPYRCSPLYSDD